MRLTLGLFWLGPGEDRGLAAARDSTRQNDTEERPGAWMGSVGRVAGVSPGVDSGAGPEQGEMGWGGGGSSLHLCPRSPRAQQ